MIAHKSLDLLRLLNNVCTNIYTQSCMRKTEKIRKTREFLRLYKKEEEILKKVIWGGFIFLAGITGIALLSASTMVTGFTLDGQYSFLWSLKSYQLIPILKLFILISIVGLVIGTWGMIEKNS